MLASETLLATSPHQGRFNDMYDSSILLQIPVTEYFYLEATALALRFATTGIVQNSIFHPVHPRRLGGRCAESQTLDTNSVHTSPTRLEHEPGLKARRISAELASLAVTFNISSCFDRCLARGFVLLVFNVFCSLLSKEEKG